MIKTNIFKHISNANNQQIMDQDIITSNKNTANK
jgi:hypothetical protein